MDFNFNFSGQNFNNFMAENSMIRFEEDDQETLKEMYRKNNPDPVDPFDDMLFEICDKKLVMKSEISNKDKELNKNDNINTKNNTNLKEEKVFRLKYNQNFFIASNLRVIDLYNHTNSYVSNEKREFKFQQQKGFQFKNLKKIYSKSKEENKTINNSELQEISNTKKGIFDNYTTNDHDKYFDANLKNVKFKNSNKQPNSILNHRKSAALPGFRSSLSILTKKNDLCKGEPHFDLKSIIENQVKIIHTYSFNQNF